MTVEWTERARDRLADIYVRLTLDAQRALVGHVERIERELALDPISRGESRGPYRRLWCTGPLAVQYDLIVGGGVVVV